MQVYLPGASWTYYDPTKRISAGFDLIPVAIARHPGQATPLAGSWLAAPMTISAWRSTSRSANLVTSLTPSRHSENTKSRYARNGFLSLAWVDQP